MTNFLKLAFVSSALAGAFALGGTAPTQAMPAQPGLAQHVEGATLVQSRRRMQQYEQYQDDDRDYNSGYAGNSWGYQGGGGWGNQGSWGYQDNVGSIGSNGSPYGYNRFSGQQFNECRIDLGYGRTQACGGGNMR